MAFLFNFIEGKRPGLGFKISGLFFLILLIIEFLLSDFYVREYEILGSGFFKIYQSNTSWWYFIKVLLLASTFAFGILYFCYKASASIYRTISRMYPFTIVLFSLFLATLISKKKPINENKTQYLASQVFEEFIDFNKYEGKEEYPLLKNKVVDRSLIPFFDLNQDKPNFVIIMMEGIGADFVGENAKYSGFTPFLDSLVNKSLYWDNFVSSAGESYAALPGLLGSLPFGQEGFTNMAKLPKRHTLYSILKDNGYSTSFNYGGNSALNKLDRFLYEERVDFILDNKGFGNAHKKQEEDAAGISLGYPDKELFNKWLADPTNLGVPRMDVFLTLSTKKPYLIPNKTQYEKQVGEFISKERDSHKASKLIGKNKDVFGSVLYLDEALKSFFKEYKNHPQYRNTIFIITGSHNMTDLPLEGGLERYRVPFIIYSPLLAEAARIPAVASHLDVAPSIVGLLSTQFDDFIQPNQTAWLGQSLVHKDIFDKNKEIPLIRHKKSIKDYISGNHFLSDGNLYRITNDLTLVEAEKSSSIYKRKYQDFKAINSYVMQNDKLIMSNESLSLNMETAPTKEELVWINSVFSGTNYDNAYETAKELAFDGKQEKALLLSNYILSQVPGHADTEILMGRIHSWDHNYSKSQEILENVVSKYPVYGEGYAALLDLYYWSDQNHLALRLEQKLIQNKMDDIEVWKKIERAKVALEKDLSVEKESISKPQAITQN